MKNRVISIILAFAMLATLAGCSSASTEASGTEIVETVEIPASVTDEKHAAKPIPAAEAFAGGNGTENDPFQIENAEQLALLAEYVNENNKEFASAYYVQTADIVMNDISNLETWDEQAPQWSWTPIGADEERFWGHYDGDGFSISGMYVYCYYNQDNRLSADTGLFGHVYEGTIKNVVLRDSYVFSYDSASVGGIVGQASFSQISNCVNSARVDGENSAFVGGVCGYASTGTVVVDSSNSGVISGMGSRSNAGANVGGICGEAIDIYNCSNSGRITSSGYAGGICGDVMLGEVSGCANSGEIVAMSSAGGIAGSGGVSVSNCYNSGTVTGGEAEHGTIGGVAGIVGITMGNVIDCKNDGKVISVEGAIAPDVGGIVGSFFGSNDENNKAVLAGCINNGNVQSMSVSSNCGGIVGMASTGKADATIDNCFNYALVSTAEGGAGGIIGLASAANELTLNVMTCVNYGQVNSGTELTDYVGGIIGSTSPWGGKIHIEGCRNEADLSGPECAGISAVVVTIENGVFECIDCVNIGDITTQGSYVGGMFRSITGDVDVKLEACMNKGNIYTTGTGFLGGLIGSIDGNNIEILDCNNEGNLIADDEISVLAGGIFGSLMSFEKLRVDGCRNSGDITVNTDNSISKETYENNPEWYYFIVGGITSSSKSAKHYTNCSNSGELTVTGNGACVSKTGDIMAMELDK